MKKDTLQNENNGVAAMILPVAGVILGAAVVAVASNPKNQKKAQDMLEQVKDKASSYMEKAEDESEAGKQKVEKTIDVVKDSDKKVGGIWKK